MSIRPHNCDMLIFHLKRPDIMQISKEPSVWMLLEWNGIIGDIAFHSELVFSSSESGQMTIHQAEPGYSELNPHQG